MALFLRIFQHLLPRSQAWRITVDKMLRRFFTAFATVYSTARDFVDLVYLDLFPTTTRALEYWEHQFGLLQAPDDVTRRMSVDAAWKAQGGQDPYYLQSIVQAAGFDLYIHEWWDGTLPPTARDPRDYAEQPTVGTVQCGETLAQCGEPTAMCDNFLGNEPGYLVNKSLDPFAPPPISSDPDAWPYFLYWGGEVFGESALILADRRQELERLLLKICPAHLWLVVIADYVDTVIDDSDDFVIDDFDAQVVA